MAENEEWNRAVAAALAEALHHEPTFTEGWDGKTIPLGYRERDRDEIVAAIRALAR